MDGNTPEDAPPPATEPSPATTTTTSTAPPSSLITRFRTLRTKTYTSFSHTHARVPYLRHLPLPALLIILLLVLLNLLVWAICGIILSFHRSTHLLGTAALAYSLGLRHALDADHISAIDLMTRRLIATGQRPVTVGTFFSLGHSTIVVVTSIVVAATAAGVSEHFDGVSTVGGIIGTSVSAAFLILLGLMNAYILGRLCLQMRRVVGMGERQAAAEGWKVEGGGVLFRVLKRMFKLIDRPWKMYPLGVLFGLGFDTSSEIALLGISSIQGARGTSMWLILIFPVLFTAGMCLIDTADGALMMSMYVAPMGMGGEKEVQTRAAEDARRQMERDWTEGGARVQEDGDEQGGNRVKDPLTFLYYSIVLTTLTVICAIVIGIIQLLSLILNVAHPTGSFWDGVEAAGDNYEIIGGAICGTFIVAGLTSVLLYGRFKSWVERKRAMLPQSTEIQPYSDEVLRSQDSVEAGHARRSGEEDGGDVIEEIVEIDGKVVGSTDASKGGVKISANELGGEASRSR
jgi:nickel/cobalt transporter (NiCoT) family protein